MNMKNFSVYTKNWQKGKIKGKNMRLVPSRITLLFYKHFTMLNVFIHRAYIIISMLILLAKLFLNFSLTIVSNVIKLSCYQVQTGKQCFLLNSVEKTFIKKWITYLENFLEYRATCC